MRTTLNVIFPCILTVPPRVLAFIMAAVRALLAGENTHPRAQIELEKTHRRIALFLAFG